MSIQKSARVAAAVAVALAAACTKNAESRTDTLAARMDTAAHNAAVRTDSAAGAVADSMHHDSANAVRGGWAPANVFGYAHVANAGEIAEGKLAEQKATNPKVKAFAREIVADHQAMMADMHKLAGKLNATMDTTTGAAHDLLNDSHDHLKDLTDKKAGADWDEDFINGEIDGHQKVLDKLQDAAKNTNDPEIRASLEKATAKVQEHLTKAQDIKNNALKH
jgi:putative membrane protein